MMNMLSKLNYFLKVEKNSCVQLPQLKQVINRMRLARMGYRIAVKLLIFIIIVINLIAIKSELWNMVKHKEQVMSKK